MYRQPRLREQLERRLLQTALRNPQPDFHYEIPSADPTKNEGAPSNAVFVGWGFSVMESSIAAPLLVVFEKWGFSIPVIVLVKHDLVPS